MTLKALIEYQEQLHASLPNDLEDSNLPDDFTIEWEEYANRWRKINTYTRDSTGCKRGTNKM